MSEKQENWMQPKSFGRADLVAKPKEKCGLSRRKSVAAEMPAD